MKSFQFRLQTLWKLRVAERRQRQMQLADALHREQLLIAQIRQAEGERTELRQRVRNLSRPGAVNVDELLQTNRYELVLLSKVKQLQHQSTELASEIQRRRHALTEADRQVRMLEKLRERKLLEHQQQELLAEVKMLDEVAQRCVPESRGTPP